MKLKYTNFKRQSDDMPDVTYVPKDLIRKHWSMQTIEFCYVCMGLVTLILLGQVISGQGVLLILGVIFLVILVWTPPILSILDNPAFQWAYPASSISIALSAIIFLPLTISLWILLFGLVINLVIAFIPKNKSYLEWCKSIRQK